MVRQGKLVKSGWDALNLLISAGAPATYIPGMKFAVVVHTWNASAGATTAVNSGFKSLLWAMCPNEIGYHIYATWAGTFGIINANASAATALGPYKSTHFALCFGFD